MDYDATMKFLVDQEVTNFFRLLGVDECIRMLPTEFAVPAKGRVDHLSKHACGTILHLEFQRDSHPEMHWRMLEYHCMICRAHGIRDDGAKGFDQVVLYIGPEAMRMSDTVATNRILFTYRLKNAKDVDPDGTLLDSENLQECVLGVLCKPSLDDRDWDQALSSIEDRAQIDLDGARDALVLLAVVCTLRDMPEAANRRMESMTFRMDIEKSPLLRGVLADAQDAAYADGRADKSRELLTRVLEDVLGRDLDDEDRRVISELDEGGADAACQAVLRQGEWEDIKATLLGHRPTGNDHSPT